MLLAVHKIDPRIRFIQAPASHTLLIISVRLNGVEKFVGYRALINTNPGQTSFDFVNVIVTDQLNEILIAFGTQPDNRFLSSYS